MCGMELRLSDDGWWWFDGSAWLPAISPDGRRRFNGREWNAERSPSGGGPGRSWLAGVGLFIGLVFTAFLCTFYGISAPAYPGQPLPGWIVALWSFTLRWGWWWLGHPGSLLRLASPCTSGPEQSKRPARS